MKHKPPVMSSSWMRRAALVDACDKLGSAAGVGVTRGADCSGENKRVLLQGGEQFMMCVTGYILVDVATAFALALLFAVAKAAYCRF